MQNRWVSLKVSVCTIIASGFAAKKVGINIKPITVGQYQKHIPNKHVP